VRVKDALGRTWSAKWGDEVKAELFAGRIAWAAGYYVEPTYFVGQGKIVGATGLKRAASHVAEDGSFLGARFQLWPKGVKLLGDEQSWAWDANRFSRQRGLAGLKLVMMLVSNWDSKDLRDVKDHGSNTGVFRMPSGVLRYTVTDWGGTLGRWGKPLFHTTWDCAGYNEQTSELVEARDDGTLDWGYSGHRHEVARDIDPRDAAWMAARLGQLRDAQIRAALEASGADPDEVDCFAKAFRARLDRLQQEIAKVRGKGLKPPREKRPHDASSG
jgi:hypothetical protein